MEDFYRQKGGGTKVIIKRKENCFRQCHFPLREGKGVYHADDLTGADQEIPD